MTHNIISTWGRFTVLLWKNIGIGNILVWVFIQKRAIYDYVLFVRIFDCPGRMNCEMS